jgi:hypothetical protein
LRVFENRMLKRIFGPKREDWAGSWRMLCNEELYNLYASPNITRMIPSRRLIWVEHVARICEIKSKYNILVRKPEEMRPFGRSVNWMHVAEDRNQWRAHVNTLMKLQLT